MELVAGGMLTPNLRLERELGHGAMGSVWIATNVALQSQVAVKVMKACDSEEQLRRFQAEARGLASLTSPHVVRIFDFGVCSDNEPFIVMELLEGEDLRTRIETVGPMPLEEVGHIIQQLCAALASAHEAGIVHRDIKPANIFLITSGNQTFVKVLDFGVAKFMGPELGMTATGMLLGTPYYASPEQLLDPKKVDHRADLWSVAVVTYACLTGKLPFVGETLSGLTIAIYEGQFERPSTLRDGLPVAIDIWMARALSQKPEDRHGSAIELAEALATALKAPRIDAGSTPLSTIVMDGTAPPTAVAAPVPVATVVASPSAGQTQAGFGDSAMVPTMAGSPALHGPSSYGLAQSTLSPMSASQPLPMPAPPAARGRGMWPMVAVVGVLLVLAGAGAFFYNRLDDGSASASTTKVPPTPSPAAVADEPAPAEPKPVEPKPSAVAEPAPSADQPASASTPSPVAAPPVPRSVTPRPISQPVLPPPPPPPPPPPAAPPGNNNPFDGKRK